MEGPTSLDLGKALLIRGKVTCRKPACRLLHSKGKAQATSLHNSTDATLNKTCWAQSRTQWRALKFENRETLGGKTVEEDEPLGP